MADIIEYKGASHLKAVDEIVGRHVEKSTTGLAAVSSTGEITMQFNTSGMYRAAANEIRHYFLVDAHYFDEFLQNKIKDYWGEWGSQFILGLRLDMVRSLLN